MDVSFNESLTNSTCTSSPVPCQNYREDIEPFFKFLQETLVSARNAEHEHPVYWFRHWGFHLIRPAEDNVAMKMCGLEDFWVLPQMPIFLVGGKQPTSYLESTCLDERPDLPRETEDIGIHSSTKDTIWAGQSLSSEVINLHSTSPFRPLQYVRCEKYLDHSSIPGIGDDDAKYISSMAILCLQRILKTRNNVNVLKMPSLLFKCDGAKPGHISWLYSQLDVQASGERSSCTKRSFLINKLESSLPIYRSLLKKLESGDRINIFKKANQENSRSYYAHYNIHSSALFGDSTVTVDFSWQGFSKPLAPPPAGSNAVIKFKAFPQNPMSVANAAYAEVSQLHDFYRIVQTSSWPFEKSSEDFERKEEEFLRYLSMEKENPEMETKVDASVLETPDAPLYELLLSEYSRKDIDFTDDLWIFLKDWRNYDYARNTIRDVFKAIFDGHMQPVLSSTNKTTIAEFLRHFYRNVGVAKEMRPYYEQLKGFTENPKRLAELILEMGIQKLTSDYIVYFQKMEVATQLQLERVISDASSFSNRLKGIVKLHYALEIMLLAKMHFRLTDDLLRTLSKSVFDYYTINETAKSTPYFALSVPSYAASAISVHKKCVNLTPSSWKCCINLKHSVSGSSDCLIFVLKDALPNEDISVPNVDETDADVNVENVEKSPRHNLVYGTTSCLRIL